jgi:hypothetical protein
MPAGHDIEELHEQAAAFTLRLVGVDVEDREEVRLLSLGLRVLIEEQRDMPHRRLQRRSVMLTAISAVIGGLATVLAGWLSHVWGPK